jgi:hypothetical protein
LLNYLENGGAYLTIQVKCVILEKSWGEEKSAELAKESVMSVRNGDKARFGRLRKQKIRLRNRIRKLRETLESKSARTAIAASEYDGASST